MNDTQRAEENIQGGKHTLVTFNLIAECGKIKTRANSECTLELLYVHITYVDQGLYIEQKGMSLSLVNT